MQITPVRLFAYFGVLSEHKRISPEVDCEHQHGVMCLVVLCLYAVTQLHLSPTGASRHTNTNSDLNNQLNTAKKKLIKSNI